MSSFIPSLHPIGALLLAIYIIELQILYLSFPEEKEMDATQPVLIATSDKVQTLRNRSLTMTGLIIAAGAFLLNVTSGATSELEGSFLIFSIAVIFFLGAYQLGDFAPHHQLWLEIQDQTFTFGLYLSALGLALAFGTISMEISSVLQGAVLLLILLRYSVLQSVFHAREYYLDESIDENVGEEEFRRDILNARMSPESIIPGITFVIVFFLIESSEYIETYGLSGFAETVMSAIISFLIVFVGGKVFRRLMPWVPKKENT